MHKHQDESAIPAPVLQAAVAVMERIGGSDSLSGLSPVASLSRLPQVAPYLICIPSGFGLGIWMRMVSGEDPYPEILRGTRFIASAGLPAALVTGEPLRAARVVGLFLGTAAWVHPRHRGMGLGRSLVSIAVHVRNENGYGPCPLSDLYSAGAVWSSLNIKSEILSRAA